jgi:hypothetical protein
LGLAYVFDGTKGQWLEAVELGLVAGGPTSIEE